MISRRVRSGKRKQTRRGTFAGLHGNPTRANRGCRRTRRGSGRGFQARCNLPAVRETVVFGNDPNQCDDSCLIKTHRRRKSFRNVRLFTQPLAGANRRWRCGCNPRRESAVAQLSTLGGKRAPQTFDDYENARCHFVDDSDLDS